MVDWSASAHNDAMIGGCLKQITGMDFYVVVAGRRQQPFIDLSSPILSLCCFPTWILDWLSYCQQGSEDPSCA
eukprot:1161364-Pelagomonas_calceolata.AAC.14